MWNLVSSFSGFGSGSGVFSVQATKNIPTKSDNTNTSKRFFIFPPHVLYNYLNPYKPQVPSFTPFHISFMINCLITFTVNNRKEIDFLKVLKKFAWNSYIHASIISQHFHKENGFFYYKTFKFSKNRISLRISIGGLR